MRVVCYQGTFRPLLSRGSRVSQSVSPAGIPLDLCSDRFAGSQSRSTSRFIITLLAASYRLAVPTVAALAVRRSLVRRTAIAVSNSGNCPLMVARSKLPNQASRGRRSSRNCSDCSITISASWVSPQRSRSVGVSASATRRQERRIDPVRRDTSRHASILPPKLRSCICPAHLDVQRVSTCT